MKLTTDEFDNWKVFFVLVVFGTFSQVGLAEKVSASQSSSASSSSGTRTSDINHSLGKGIPANILAQIGSLDQHLKCFPKLLCTIYQDDSIRRRGFVNATELGVAYVKLLKAVHYENPTVSTSTTTNAPKVKRPIIQVFQIPMGMITSYYSGRKNIPHELDDLEEDHPVYFRSHKNKEAPYYENRNDYSVDNDYDLRQDDIDREHLREKAEMSQLMEELINEDKAELQSSDEPSSYSSSIGGGGGGSGSVATSLLSSFFPFLGSRSMGDSKGLFRSADKSKRIVTTPNSPDTRQRNRRLYRSSSTTKKDPFMKAVGMWKNLKRRSQCREMYNECPFESWEIVRMLDLVKGQAKILSTYLKITVDNVKPASMRN